MSLTSFFTNKKANKILLGILFAFSVFGFTYEAKASVILPDNLRDPGVPVTCGELAFGGTYTLTQNITGATSTCFIISTDGVTINGAGLSVTASGTVPLAIDARAYNTPGLTSSGLQDGANGYNNTIITNLTLNGFTAGLNSSGNNDTDGNGVNGGYGGLGGDILVDSSSVGSIYSNGGNTTLSYGNSGGNITIYSANLDISNSTFSVAAGNGTTGVGSPGGLFINYTGTFTHVNTFVSALSYFNINGTDTGYYPGGTWPIFPGTISTCGTLMGNSTSTNLYTLSGNIGSTSSPLTTSCFTLVSNNITIDGAGFKV